MRLYASDGKNLIYAPEASSEKIYQCLECHGPLKVRFGANRFPHFYHFRRSHCLIHMKNFFHAYVQNYLQQILPVELEKPFPKILRIADAVWEEKKIVFEIQCSKITIEEVEARSKDYASQNYQLVWILHDEMFNKSHISAAEKYLRKKACYFTNLRPGKEGFIYDQFDMYRGHRRIKLGPSMQINIGEAVFFCKKKLSRQSSLPQCVKERLSSHSLYFIGDLTDRVLHSKVSRSFNIATQIIFWEKKFRRRPIASLKIFQFLSQIFTNTVKRLCKEKTGMYKKTKAHARKARYYGKWK